MRTLAAFLFVSIFFSSAPDRAVAQQSFGQAEAEMVRRAVDKVKDSVVRIELVGVAEERGGTEVASNAPTVGTIVDSEGWILASSLVADSPAASILVVLPDGTRATARIVAKDAGRELVLLKADVSSPLQAIEWYVEKPAAVGQYAIAVGRFADAGSPAVSVGIISARNRLWGKALQTDARISPAFYGGPLIDILGNVHGIVVPAVPEQGGVEEKTGWYDSGIGFAIDSKSIVDRLEKLKSGEDIQKGVLGIVSADSDPYSAGTTIEAVRLRSPAEKAGLKGGDVVIELDGMPVKRYYQIRQTLGKFDAGDKVNLTVERDGKRIELQATLVSDIPPFDPQMIGIYADKTEAGVRVRATIPSSPAADAGLQRGDRITRLQDREVPSPAALRRRVMSHDPETLLKAIVRRGDETLEFELSTRSIAGTLAEVSPPPVLGGGGADAEKDNDGTADDDQADDVAWKETNLDLPDVSNKAVSLAPADAEEVPPRGVLIVMADPGETPGKESLDRWRAAAKDLRVAVAVVFAADNEGWTPPEADVAGQIAAKLAQQWGLDRSAVGVTGETTGPSFAMAVVVAMTQDASISGVFASTEMRPPAMRLTENDPALPSQICLPIDQKDDLPSWANVLPRAGYPVVRVKDTQPKTILEWVVSLSRI